MKIYTDGSYNKKISPDSTAYAAIIIKEETDIKYIVDIIYGVNVDKNYTSLWNVGGEIWAVLVGIDYAITNYHPCSIQVYHDYIGLSNWVTNKWKAKNSVTQAYKNYICNRMSECEISFIHVPGHSNIQLNEFADQYAKCGTTNYIKKMIQTQLEKDIQIMKR